jgi:two-component system, LytTR family, sensor kinase
VQSPQPVTKRYLFVLIALWLIWSGIHFSLLYNWDFPMATAITDSLVSNVLLLGIGLLAANYLRYYRPQKGKYLYIIFFCITISGMWAFGIRYILEKTFSTDSIYVAFLYKSITVRYNVALLVTGCMTLIGELWYSIKEQREDESRQAAAEKLAKDAELYKLRQQLQPHFLFNSLNSISALAGRNPELARKMIQQLSDFLRGTLKKEENQWTTLGEELQHLQLYLDIEKVRFGHRLNTNIASDDTSNRQQLPHMLLQPLVENAIKFGLYDTTEDVTITIEATTTGNYLIISVQNPFDPETSAPKHGTGFGLSSVQRRLYLLFARHDLLATVVAHNIFITTIKIPQAI